jgi:hypothetical protein
MADQSLISRTAMMLTPYCSSPTAKLMYSLVAAAVRAFSSSRRLPKSGVDISLLAATAAVMIFISDIKLR